MPSVAAGEARASREPIPFAGSTLGDFRHVCAFFSSPEDESRTLMPFTREGLTAGHRLVHIVPRDRGGYEDELRSDGIDVNAYRVTAQLEILQSESAYGDGGFNQEWMLDQLQGLLNKGRSLGFPVTRLIAHAEHITRDPAGAKAFVEYESKLNYVLPQLPDTVVCTYDLNRINADVALDVLRTHPMVVIGGLLQENPFFVAPATFLREMNERRASVHRKPARAGPKS